MLLLRRLPVLIIFSWNFLVALISADDIPMIGPAVFRLMEFKMCQENENTPNMISIHRDKVNRTVESFQGYFLLAVDFDDTVRINLNLAKWGDGGYKPNYYIENNTNACHFFFKWAANGMKRLLESAGRPGKCPMTKGKVEWKNFIVNYDEWPSTMVYGEFRATLKFIQNDEIIMCYQWFFSSKPKNVFG